MCGNVTNFIDSEIKEQDDIGEKSGKSKNKGISILPGEINISVNGTHRSRNIGIKPVEAIDFVNDASFLVIVTLVFLDKERLGQQSHLNTNPD